MASGVELAGPVPNGRQPMKQNFNICHVAINKFHRIYDDLIASLAGGLVELGHDCSVTRNGYVAGATNILVGSTIFASRHQGLPDRFRGRPYIVYQLEQLDDRQGLLKEWPEYWELLTNASAIWDYAPSSTAYLRARDLKDVFYVPPSYHPSLEAFRPADTQDIDVLFYGSPHDRRIRIMQELQLRGVKALYLHSKVGADRNDFIRRARIILNIHAWDGLDMLETIRISFVLANRCFVISESSDHNPYADGVVYAPYDKLVEACLHYLSAAPDLRATIADRGYRALRRRGMADVLREVLSP
jgi:hypothetical protein